MRFTKMQGLGNDYVYLNGLDGLPEDLPELARRMSDRHFGVGSDGLICICPSQTADFKMRIFNADGSEGEMCGNGIRCLGKYVYDKGLTGKRELIVETAAGLRTLELLVENGRVASVRVDMGCPQVGEPLELMAAGKSWTVTPVSMGNPHGVLFVDRLEALDLEGLGPQFEHHPAFPQGINTEFVACLAPDRLTIRVWERGHAGLWYRRLRRSGGGGGPGTDGAAGIRPTARRGAGAVLAQRRDNLHDRPGRDGF